MQFTPKNYGPFQKVLIEVMVTCFFTVANTNHEEGALSFLEGQLITLTLTRGTIASNTFISALKMDVFSSSYAKVN